MLKRIILSIFIAVIFLVPSIAESSAERDITKQTLPNGLKVIIEEDHSAPVVALQFWVHVGSADEKENEAGVAHVFEHMLFKGTEKRGLGDIAREVEASGGSINAYTSYDNTVYHIVMPSRRFAVGLDILSDAIRNSSFDPNELAKELEVVLEEIRMGEDNPGRKLFKSLLSNAYTTHPYKDTVIGYNETVSALTRDYILEFFDKWYRPENMTLVITGDVNKEEAMNEVNALLSDFKRGDHERAVRAVEPPQNETRIEVIEYDTKLAQIGIAFHVPEQKHHDIFAIDVMSEVLTSGINSRLYKALKIDKQLVTSISTYAMTPKDPGVFLITATLETKNIEETLIDVVSVIKELGRDGANQRELKKIKSSLESSFIYSRETMEGKASQLGYYETISGSLEFEKEYLKGINAVTKEDIKNAVNKYLDFSGMTISLILPSDDTNNISENVLRRYVKKAVSKKQTPKETLKADKNGVIKLTLPNGVTLLVKEDHSNETVGIYSAFTGGIRSEQEETNGIGNLLSGMLTRGTKKYTRQELARELEDISGSIGGFSGRNTTGMSAEFLSKHFDKGFSLFSEVLLNPTFPQTELDLLKQDILAAIKKQEDYIPGYTFKLLYKELYGDHPYSMPVIGTKHSVTDITTDALRDHYKMIFTPERMVIAIVGDVEASYAVKLISESFSSFRSTEAPLPVTPSIISPESIIETGDTKEKQQTNIGIGFTGTTIDSADKYPLKIIAELLGSHGGRLFVELRDKKSLAYSVFAFSRSGIEPGIFGLYIGCSPDKEDEAIESIFTELRKLTSTRVSKKELARVKNSIAGSYEIGLQDVMSQASDMATNELVGLGYDYSERYVKMINKVSANDIKKIAKKFFTLDKYVISVVGPAIDSETEENSAVEDNNENNDHPVN